ncbi:MAG: hypothetical protein JSS02_27740 [Planctomycetes bacterium]|nr:hypothetical protein [Planctomycetota bacterium]
MDNPNAAAFGTWSYRQGTTLLPHVADWTPLGASPAQPAWAVGTTSGNFLPAIFKATSAPLDWQVGDVVIHTTDESNGAAYGPANIVWTSPFAATINVSGATRIARDIGRSNDWFLYKNNVLLTSGNVASGDAYSRAHPFSFADGSGGSSALSGLVVGAGDTIRLEFVRTCHDGDFVGVNLAIEGTRITSSAVPEPTGVILWGCAFLVGQPSLENDGMQAGRSIQFMIEARMAVDDARGIAAVSPGASFWVNKFRRLALFVRQPPVVLGV